EGDGCVTEGWYLALRAFRQTGKTALRAVFRKSNRSDSNVCLDAKKDGRSAVVREFGVFREFWDSSSSAPPDREEQPALAAQRHRPRELRDPALHAPIVLRRREQLLGIVIEHRARIAAQTIDAGLVEPSHHLTDRVRVLFGMPILI